MIDSLIVLILFMNNGIMEHVGYDSISNCLKAKRHIERTGWKDTDYKRYSCEKKKVELKKGLDDKYFIVRIVE